MPPPKKQMSEPLQVMNLAVSKTTYSFPFDSPERTFNFLRLLKWQNQPQK